MTLVSTTEVERIITEHALFFAARFRAATLEVIASYVAAGHVTADEAEQCKKDLESHLVDLLKQLNEQARDDLKQLAKEFAETN